MISIQTKKKISYYAVTVPLAHILLPVALRTIILFVLTASTKTASAVPMPVTDNVASDSTHVLASPAKSVAMDLAMAIKLASRLCSIGSE